MLLAVIRLFQLLLPLVSRLLIFDPLTLAWRLSGLEDLLPWWVVSLLWRLLLLLVRVRLPQLLHPGV